MREASPWNKSIPPAVEFGGLRLAPDKLAIKNTESWKNYSDGLRAMAEFDPYLKWLGIRDAQRPPSHYRLLGVEPFESDTEVIGAAADRQMAHVRSFQAGEHAELARQILSELAMARRCLMSPEKRQAYDRELAASPPAAPVAQASIGEPPRPAPAEPPLARPVVNVPQSIRVNSTAERKRRQSVWPLVLAAVGAVICATVGIAVYINVFNNNSPAEADLDPQASGVGDGGSGSAGASGRGDVADLGAGAADKKGGNNKAGGNNKEDVGQGRDAENGKGLADSGQPSAEQRSRSRRAPWRTQWAAGPLPGYLADQREPLGKPLQHFHVALALRKYDQAKQVYDRLMESARAAELGGDSIEAQFDRARDRFDQLQEFWKIYAEQVQRLEPGAEIRFNQQMVEVVSVDGTHVELRAGNGEQQRFQLDRNVVRFELAIAVVRERGEAETKPLVDFFWQVDHLARADRLPFAYDHQLALADCAQLAGSLLPNANVPMPADPQRPFGDGTEGPGLPVVSGGSRIAPPDATQQVEQREVYRALFGAEENAARSSEERLAFAARLAEAAAGSGQDPDSQHLRYVVMEKAADFYVEGGRLDQAVELLLERGKIFEVDALADCLEFNQKFTRIYRLKSLSAEQLEKTIRLYSQLWDAAIEQEKFDVAARWIDEGRAVLRTMDDRDSLKELSVLEGHVRDRSKLQAACQQAVETLGQQPDDPVLLTQIAEFEFAVRGDLDAIEQLAAGDSRLFGGPARVMVESGAQPDTQQQTAIGDAWFNDWEQGTRFENWVCGRQALAAYESLLESAGSDALPLATREQVQRRVEQLREELEIFDAGQASAIPRALFENSWAIAWASETPWSQLRFRRDRTVRFVRNGQEQTQTWSFVDGVLQFRAQNRVYSFRPGGARQLNCQVYVPANRKTIHGVGTPE